jgi:hypothetical protein
VAKKNGARVSDFIPKPPRALYTLLEGRALLEMALLPALYPVLRGTPQGDGHPVLLVPGFTAGDSTLIGLSAFLRTRGYHVETWGLGQNTGFKLKFSQSSRADKQGIAHPELCIRKPHQQGQHQYRRNIEGDCNRCNHTSNEHGINSERQQQVAVGQPVLGVPGEEQPHDQYRKRKEHQ